MQSVKIPEKKSGDPSSKVFIRVSVLNDLKIGKKQLWHVWKKRRIKKGEVVDRPPHRHHYHHRQYQCCGCCFSEAFDQVVFAEAQLKAVDDNVLSEVFEQRHSSSSWRSIWVIPSQGVKSIRGLSGSLPGPDLQPFRLMPGFSWARTLWLEVRSSSLFLTASDRLCSNGVTTRSSSFSRMWESEGSVYSNVCVVAAVHQKTQIKS